MKMWVPCVLCTACSTLRLSVGPSSPCDVSVADTDSPPPPLVPFTPHTPTHPVSFLIASSPLNMLIFLFLFYCQPSCTELYHSRCYFSVVILFFFFTFPTVVVTFYSDVLLFRLFSCFVFFRLSVICLLLWKSYTKLYVWSSVFWWKQKMKKTKQKKTNN